MSIASYAEVRDMVIHGDNGINQYCIIAVDEFSFEDYPIYAVDRNEAISLIDRTNGLNMQRVLEVYNYQQDLEEQFKESRTWRI
jgi:hypothetical protein